MSCGKDYYTSSCVCDTLAAIADAQDSVDNNNGNCTTSCNRSIQELLGEVSPFSTGNNTIPVTLTCKSTCAPFIGLAAQPLNGTRNFVVSGVFRVNEVDVETCCATLELLSPVDLDPAQNQFDNPALVLASAEQEGNLVSSGLCITVDLSCFCGVTCLQPDNV